MPLEQILLAVLAIINIFTFLVMASDKRKSTASNNPDRFPYGRIIPSYRGRQHRHLHRHDPPAPQNPQMVLSDWFTSVNFVKYDTNILLYQSTFP